jgi:hypothetical protein
MTSPAARGALRRLFLDLFKGTQLRRHVGVLADDYRVADELPEGGGRADLAQRLIAKKRPRRKLAIAFVSRQWTG